MRRTITKTVEEEKEFQRQLKENYRERILKYHPDRNHDPTKNNERIAREVILACDILNDKHRRARYINVMDSKSWGRFLKTIYWPEPTSEDEEKNRTWHLAKRLSYTFVSAGLVAGGVAIVATTGGVAAPIVGFALIGGGIQGGTRSVVKENLEFKDYMISTTLGAVVGAATGGAAAGASAALAGAGGALTVGQQAAVGTISGITNGFGSSVSNNIEKVIVDKERISSKKFIKDAAFGAVFGAGVGAAGGAVEGAINLAGTQFLDEAAEVAVATGSRKVGFKILGKAAQKITEKTIEKIGEKNYKFLEERMNDDFENKD